MEHKGQQAQTQAELRKRYKDADRDSDTSHCLSAMVRKVVGTRAHNALKRGRLLVRWRQSSPHNWFIERADCNGYLWHSCPGEKFPPLHLFRMVYADDSMEFYILKEASNGQSR